MTDKFEKNITNAGQEYSLSLEEREKMTRIITTYMKHKPLARGAAAPITHQSYSFFFYAHRTFAASLAFVLIFGSSMSYAAEGALPGDTLYGVKTFITEPVRVALATSAEAEAEVHIELAERRIEEAATLAGDGRLDSETQENLAIAFESHASQAESAMQEVSKDDTGAAVALSSSFETKLAAHDEVLALVQEGLENAQTTRLSDSIRVRGYALADSRARTEGKIAMSAEPQEAATMSMSMRAIESDEAPQVSDEPAKEQVQDEKAAERMQKSAEKLLKQSKKKVRAADLQGDEKIRVEGELTFAEHLIETGKEHLDSGEIALAFHSFQEALIIAEKNAVLSKAAPALAKAKARVTRDGKDSSKSSVKVNAKSHTIEIKPEAASNAHGTPIDVTAATELQTTTMMFDASIETNSTSSEKILPPSIKIFPTEDHDGEVKGEDDVVESIKKGLPL